MDPELLKLVATAAAAFGSGIGTALIYARRRFGNQDNPGHGCRFSGTAVREALEPLRESVTAVQTGQAQISGRLHGIAEAINGLHSAVRAIDRN